MYAQDIRAPNTKNIQAETDFLNISDKDEISKADSKYDITEHPGGNGRHALRVWGDLGHGVEDVDEHQEECDKKCHSARDNLEYFKMTYLGPIAPVPVSSVLN